MYLVFLFRTVPKFIRKIKAPDYKDKNVFGVPLLLNVQRTSHPLPRGILQAMEYLRRHFLDQVQTLIKPEQDLRDPRQHFRDEELLESQPPIFILTRQKNIISFLYLLTLSGNRPEWMSYQDTSIVLF